jgi:hypothetical protein
MPWKGSWSEVDEEKNQKHEFLGAGRQTTTTAVRVGGEIVPSEDVSLQGDPLAIASGHLPRRLKTWRSVY